MNQSSSQQYVIGRDRKCDVVVDDPRVAAFHCKLSREKDRWILTPQEGSIGIRRSPSAEFDWSKTAVAIQPADDLWLTPETRLPWPCESGASRVLTVGRAIDCDVTLDNASVSGQHARLIVGPRSTLVLQDCSSRNGLFVNANLSPRVSAVMLQSDQDVYFGSYKVSATDLSNLGNVLSKPGGQTPPVVSEQPGRARTNTAPRSSPAGATSWTKQASLIGLPILATIVVWFVWSSRSNSTVDQPPQVAAKVSPRDSTPGQRVSPTPPVETKQSEESEIVKPSSVEPPVSSAPISAPVRDIRKSVYWVLIRHEATDTRYRLGSAVAIAPNKILTTGSILRSIDQMITKGYSDPAVTLVDGGPLLPVTSRRTWPEFLKRTERSNKLRKAHEKLIKDASGDPSSEEIARSTRLLNFSISAASAADIGWLVVDGLEHHLEIGLPVAYRPGQAVTLCNAGFDGKDPFCDPGQDQAEIPMEQQTVRLRVRGQGPSVEEIPGVIQLDCPKSINRDENLIGAPLIRNDDVVGIIVFQTSEDADSTMAVEAVSGRTLSDAIKAMNEVSAPPSG